MPPLINGEQPLRIVLDGKQNHSSMNRSSTYSNALICGLSRYINDKKLTPGGWRTYSNALRCRLSRLAMIKNNASRHRRTYSNTLRCRLSRLAMIKNNKSRHRRTYSNALRCRLSRLAMIKNAFRGTGVTTQTFSDVVYRSARIYVNICAAALHHLLRSPCTIRAVNVLNLQRHI